MGSMQALEHWISLIENDVAGLIVTKQNVHIRLVSKVVTGIKISDFVLLHV